MRSFFKYFFAVILGGIVSAFTLILLLIIIGVGIAASGESEATIRSNSILKLDLNGRVVERKSANPFEELMSGLNDEPKTRALNDILSSLKKAKRDTNIVGIYLRCGMIETGYATIEEIRNALIDFKSSGKFVVSYDEIYAQKGYYLASASDKIYLLKEGMLQLQGLNMENIYFKNLFAKLGIEFTAFRHGKYKSGIESFTADKMSDEDRLQRKELLMGIWAHMASKISESRNISLLDLEAFVSNNSMMSSNDKVLNAKLIDGLVYEDEIIADLKQRTNIKTEDKLELASLSDYKTVAVPDTSVKELTLDKIAIIYAEGVIDGGGKDGIISKELAKTIREAREDKNIKAIVLRINSPGGSAMGSDVIWREAMLAKKVKPLVVSMSDLAASGGYYIACVADTIFAQKATITGSVGIYAQIPNLKGAKEKFGLNLDNVSTHNSSDFLNSLSFLSRTWTNGDKQIIQAYVDRGYQTFISRVSEGRSMSTSAVDEIAQGRVWTGLAAQGNHLVDAIGGIDDAIAYAKKKAKLENCRVVELPEELDPFQQFMKDFGGESKLFSLFNLMNSDVNPNDVKNLILQQDPLQVRLPYEINIY